MALKRANVFVSGNVQMAGFRTFVKNFADSLDIKGYAENLPDGRVQIVCEGDEIGIAELANAIKTKAPALSTVEDLQIKYGEYAGEFLDFERRGEDVPRKATLDDLLNVMKSFDNKAEKMVGILGEIKSDTSQIRQDTTQIKEDTSQIRQDTTQIKEDTSQIRQDTARIKEDTSQIRQDTARIKEDTSNIPIIVENTSRIPAMREDTSGIKNNTREIADNFQGKYEEMSREILQMKITLSRIEAKVFG
ncbi:MAG: acylphosphatase [Candidatus Methanoperedens sp.]|nr:acylphosphatase [Candidatus Methanoperedens sp.]